METLLLNNGVEIPRVGFGTYRSTLDDGYKVVADALRAGYRHLDTAMGYKNEGDVGRAIAESGIERSELFITSKISRNHLGYERAYEMLDASLKRLGTDYLDLYLIHWPRPSYGRPGWDDWAALDRETWRALEEFLEQGKVRAIGVSNFMPEHLDNLMTTAKVTPAVNQLELHAGYMQSDTVAYTQKLGIAIESWSPLGRARMLAHPVLLEVAKHYSATGAQVALSYVYQKGYIVLPKSAHFDRMVQNLDPAALVLSEEDVEKIDQMPMAGFSGEHPNRQTVPPQTT